jgi:hypothetical protein
MDQISYFQSPPNQGPLKTTIYVYLFHIIYKVGTAYSIKWGSDTHSHPLDIRGEIIDVHSVNGQFAYVCTDIATYYITHDLCIRCTTSTDEDFICSTARIGRHYMILSSNTETIYYIDDSDYSNINNTKAVVNSNIVIIGNCRSIGPRILQSPFTPTNVPCHYPSEAMGALVEMYFFQNSWIYHCVDGKYYVASGKFVHQVDMKGVVIVKTIADYNGGTRFSHQNLYLIDDLCNVYIISKFKTLVKVCTVNSIGDSISADSICDIISLHDHQIIICGSNYLHVYPVIDNTESVTTIAKMSTDYPVSVISNLNNTQTVLKCGPDFIVIAPNIVESQNKSIICSYPQFDISLQYKTTIVRATKGQLHYSLGFVLVDRYEATNLQGKPIIYNNPSYCVFKNLYPLSVSIEIAFNVFDQFMNTMISTNFYHKLEIYAMEYDKQTSSGPGVNRDFHHQVAEYIHANLVVLAHHHHGYKLNLSHPFWSDNSAYYFGKLIAYLMSVDCCLPFHFTPGVLYVIYRIIQFRNGVTTSCIDQLAPFHKHFYPLDYIHMFNLNDEYKTDPILFQNLCLEYDSFHHMIAEKFNDSSALELQYLQFIAMGMHDFAPGLTNITMWDMSIMMSGNYTYDRHKVIEHISIVVENSHCTEQRLIDCIPKMKKFIEQLSNDELMQFMITVTGYHIRDSGAHVIIYHQLSNNLDVCIATCYDRLNVSSHVFDTAGYEDILKGYLCVRDTHIHD